jgi:hypothetical protein
MAASMSDSVKIGYCDCKAIENLFKMVITNYKPYTSSFNDFFFKRKSKREIESLERTRKTLENSLYNPIKKVTMRNNNYQIIS